MRLLKTFVHDEMDYINDFLTIYTLGETIQWYSNVLLNFNNTYFFNIVYMAQNE